MIGSKTFLTCTALAGLLLVAAPASARADGASTHCSATEQLAFGDCIASSTDECAAGVPNCSLDKDIGATSTADFVTTALGKCCGLSKLRSQRTCLKFQRARTILVKLDIPPVYTEVRKLLKNTARQLAELLLEPDPCSTVSLE